MLSYAAGILKHYLTLPAVLAAVAAGALCALFCRRREAQGRMDRKQSAALALLCAYLVLMLCFLVFARTQKTTHRFSMQLFWSYRAIRQGKRYLLYLDLFNVLLFVPFGALWPTAAKVSQPWKTIAAGATLSLLGELLQAATARGLFELDDLFHNILGTALGLGLRYLARKLWGRYGDKARGLLRSCAARIREHIGRIGDRQQ